LLKPTRMLLALNPTRMLLALYPMTILILIQSVMLCSIPSQVHIAASTAELLQRAPAHVLQRVGSALTEPPAAVGRCAPLACCPQRRTRAYEAGVGAGAAALSFRIELRGALWLWRASHTSGRAAEAFRPVTLRRRGAADSLDRAWDTCLGRPGTDMACAQPHRRDQYQGKGPHAHVLAHARWGRPGVQGAHVGAAAPVAQAQTDPVAP
jgi:hypothetical protein